MKTPRRSHPDERLVARDGFGEPHFPGARSFRVLPSAIGFENVTIEIRREQAGSADVAGRPSRDRLSESNAQ